MIVTASASLPLSANWLSHNFSKLILNNQFKEYLQPQVDRNGRIIGAEVLSRLSLLNGQIIPAASFINPIIRINLIHKLDEYIWKTAVCTLNRWKNTPLKDLYLSINVDPADFSHMDVASKLLGYCAEFDVDPSRLHIEITERSLEFSNEYLTGFINDLRNKAFHVEMDDFGIGERSISSLIDSYYDTLKLDRSIFTAEDKSREMIIVSSIVSMAHQLKMKVIAEGIEDEEQFAFAAKAGCDFFQGFYFSKPMPISEFEKRILSASEDSFS